MKASLKSFCRTKLAAVGGLLLLTAATSLAQVSVNIGTLQPGQSVTISYEVTIDPALPNAVTAISSQGIVSGDNFAQVNTDDPETTALDDPTLTLISNHSPVAGLDTVLRAPDEDVKVQVSTLLANDTDAEGDALSLTGVTSPTPGGATVTLTDGWIYYLHNGTSADSFVYGLTDGHGGSAQGTVLVQIKNPDAQARSTLSITVDGAGAHVRADGIPGNTYTIQFKDNVLDPWQTLGTTTADAAGLYLLSDPAGSLVRIYRSVRF